MRFLQDVVSLNVFTLAPDPDRTLACLPFERPEYIYLRSGRARARARVRVLLAHRLAPVVKRIQIAPCNVNGLSRLGGEQFRERTLELKAALMDCECKCWTLGSQVLRILDRNCLVSGAC